MHACREVQAAVSIAGKRTESLDYAAHAGDLGATATVALDRPDVWYLGSIKRRWILDPCEWDEAYAAGVATLEVSIAEFPGVWDMAWIRASTTRCAAGPCAAELAGFVRGACGRARMW